MATGNDGAAQDLPAGRLRGFEDGGDDATQELGALLSRRAPARTRPVEQDPAAAADAAPTDTAPAQPPQKAPAASTRRDQKNVIRPSSVQVPVAMIEKITAERERTGRSNGEIVIDALEQCHPRLDSLIGRRGSAGGGLFTSRASRGVRLVVGPLTALNIRLLEADYDVIDGLVEQFGAFSRGHLITAALTDYFDHTPPA